MTRNIEDLRREYRNEELKQEDMPDDPITLFEKWFNQALETDPYDANAMHLATVDDQGRPSIRVVLIKGYSNEGFVFYTNYNSQKGREIKKNPHCALNFFWSDLMRQVRIEGKAEKIHHSKSDEYFDSRPEGSRIAAIASPQSEIVESREELKEKFKSVEKQWKEAPLKRPPHWGGYRVKPSRIEFWQGRENRYHDRIKYSLLKDGQWTLHRLAP